MPCSPASPNKRGSNRAPHSSAGGGAGGDAASSTGYGFGTALEAVSGTPAGGAEALALGELAAGLGFHRLIWISTAVSALFSCSAVLLTLPLMRVPSERKLTSSTKFFEPVMNWARLPRAP